MDVIETHEGKYIYDHDYYGDDDLVAIFCKWCRVDDIYGSSSSTSVASNV